MPDQEMIVEISCFEVWRQISDYIENEVDSDLKARLAYHFAHCRDCKALLDGTRNVITLIGDEKAFELPTGASQRITEALARRIAEDREAIE
jgi:Putative zinc-finger